MHRQAQDAEGLDYECELVAVIGKTCTDVSEADALKYVFGYAIGNDVSHREWQIQRGGGQWSLGKGFDGWAPFGPGIVSSQVIKDPHTLKISTRLNGKTVQVSESERDVKGTFIIDNKLQESNTADMIFDVKKTISFLSKGHTLLPGDIIFTGTPSGVGMGRNPKLWMRDGDIVEVELEGVGVCTNKVEFAKESAKL